MMNIYTVCFFGHRYIECGTEIENRLDKLLHDLITQKEYVDFLIGRDGEFDLLASASIKRAIRSYSYGNTHFTLVLPYMKAEYRDNEKEYLDYYDEVEVCAESSEAHPKSAIQVRNRSMIDRADLVVCCIQHKSGGAYATMDKMVVPRAERHEAVFYNVEELNELFEVFKGNKLELIVHIAAYYGLRRCEILGLKWDSIDFKKGTITIERKVVCDYDENGQSKLFVETRLKTHSTRRTLPLIPHIKEMLLEKKDMDKRYKKLCGKEYNTEFEGFVCCDPYGKLISPNTVTHDFHQVIKKNGLKMLRFHDLRHSCASLLLANDIPMKAIQEWLGHATFNITVLLHNSNTSHQAYQTD